MKNQVIGLIPARWSSTRFPGKPLHYIAGKPLIEHVWDRCMRCKNLNRIVIATDDRRILEAAEAFGAQVVMTRDDHPTGTDRIAEAATAFPEATHFINVQGDEPLIDPQLIDELAAALLDDPSLPMVTAANVLTDPILIRDPNVVKVVLNSDRKALYFSRSPIPYARDSEEDLIWYRHKGLYGYTRAFLLEFVSWPPSPLETIEQLEQLRALENGASIGVIVTDDDSLGVDTPEQAEWVHRLILEQSHA